MLPSIEPAALGILPLADPVLWASGPGDKSMPGRYVNPGELNAIVGLMKSLEPKTVIEFGVNVGRTAKMALREIPSIKQYIGIDASPGYAPRLTVQKKEVPRNPGWMVKDDSRFTLITRERGSLDLSAEDLPLADAAYIDGDHSLPCVSHDTALADRIIRPGGIIIWHDYHMLGTVAVKPFLDERRAAGHDIKLVAGTWLAFERR